MDQGFERSVFIGDNTGVVSTGNNASIAQFTLASGAPKPVVAVPAPPDVFGFHSGGSPVFRGRINEQKRLKGILDGAPGSVAVITGGGGVGKTSLAAQTASEYRGKYNPIWELSAGDATQIEFGLSRLACRIDPGLADHPSEVAAEWARAWLQTHDDWLLVLDNASSPREVRALLNQLPRGRFIVTSQQATGWHHVGPAMPLGVLDPDAALDLLVTIAGGSALDSEDLSSSALVCEELGYLPLAIELAAAHMAQTRLTPLHYLENLRVTPLDALLDHSASEDAEHSVAKVLQGNLEKISGHPLAEELLRVLAWFAPDEIPCSLLFRMDSPQAVRTAVGLLARYSVVRWTEGASEPTLHVHRLVQTLVIAWNQNSPDGTFESSFTATNLLREAMRDEYPEEGFKTRRHRSLMPHLDSLASKIDTDDETLGAAALYQIAAHFLLSQGQSGHANHYAERSHQVMTRIGGGPAGSPDIQNLLGHIRYSTGNMAGAAEYFKRALDEATPSFGEDNRNVLTYRINYARAILACGDHAAAISMLGDAVSNCMNILGGDDPITLSACANLGHAYEVSGDIATAISLYSQVLFDRLRTLGLDHEATAASFAVLGGVYLANGDPSGAAPYLEQALGVRVRVLGDDHLDTVISRNNLAVALCEDSKPRRAIPLLERAIDDAPGIFAPDSAELTSMQERLGSLYISTGQPNRAISMYSQLLETRIQTIGVDHPATLAIQNMLGFSYRAAGDLSRAIVFYEQALIGRTRALGPDHQDTFNSRNNLAYAYKLAGDLARAIPLYEETLEFAASKLGHNDPAVINMRNDIRSLRDQT
ncbi:FxSxx-COOH system tetratricopeptide repeat protein [Streptomyces antimycoticus]|uniref:ATP-binding protein n=1 Tax=Streptomyces antimycoticus TaxID=68175 RepID=A0A4D4KE25_9ACTN|nr:FxSxx-COOH system tetratricopeptide repeat protein [Streptomyces antimycoticus]GDY46582.1 ATP-binding protein [Streptomyces antimycoticus]